jgi:hypothetical protein
MNHLSFWRKRGRRLRNKNTILPTKIRLDSELFFDETTGGMASGGGAAFAAHSSVWTAGGDECW